ncbi:PDC sensor domain-containing protein [Azospirillum himalayense]|uniref:PDC sensor domain-containing protein n=1 Tax=Azospirillum himalayense TaxID=654847 RepID=A0ABW0G737_9PROT
MTKRFSLLLSTAAVLATLGTLPAYAADPALEASVRKTVSPQAQTWLADPAVVDAVKAQNTAHKGLDQAKIDAMDNDWKAAAKAKSANPTYDTIAANAVTKRLKEVTDKSNGRIVEILLMDNRGLNVAQTGGTSDYWQGDEPKWQKVYSGGSDLYMTDPEKDAETNAMLTEVSVPVLDPASKEKIGVAMIVLDTSKLGN